MSYFVALTLNDSIKNDICETIVRLRTQSLSGNFSSRSNLHATLAFLGDNVDIEAVKAAMDAVDAKPFEIEVGGYGIFNKRTGNVHWTQIKPSSELDAMRAGLITALKDKGLKPDETEFKPHITLGREVVTIKTFNPATFSRSVPKNTQTVADITLMQSEHIDGKLTYTPVYVKTLG